MADVLSLIISGVSLLSHVLICRRHPMPSCVCAQSLRHVQLFATPWTAAHQAPLHMEFSGKNTTVGCHFLLQGIFHTQGSNPHLLYLLHWQEDSLPLCHLGIREDAWSGEMLSGKTCCSLRQISSDPAVFTVRHDLTPNPNNYMRDQTEQSVVIQKITHNVSEYLLTRANNLFFITSTTFGNQLMSSPICPQ